VIEDAEKPLQASTKGIVTIDGTIEEKEMDQREEVQQDMPSRRRRSWSKPTSAWSSRSRRSTPTAACSSST
jgi:hypothetical protein